MSDEFLDKVIAVAFILLAIAAFLNACLMTANVVYRIHFAVSTM